MANWYDKEVGQLETDLEAGFISNEEYRRALRDLNDELRSAAEEAAEQSYQDAIGNW